MNEYVEENSDSSAGFRDVNSRRKALGKDKATIIKPYRLISREDFKAFKKRVEKRRAKKGYR